MKMNITCNPTSGSNRAGDKLIISISKEAYLTLINNKRISFKL